VERQEPTFGNDVSEVEFNAYERHQALLDAEEAVRVFSEEMKNLEWQLAASMTVAPAAPVRTIHPVPPGYRCSGGAILHRSGNRALQPRLLSARRHRGRLLSDHAGKCRLPLSKVGRSRCQALRGAQLGPRSDDKTHLAGPTPAIGLTGSGSLPIG